MRGKGNLSPNWQQQDGKYALRIVDPGLHYHRYTIAVKTSYFDDATQTQSFMERCKCGVYNVIYTRFDRSGNRITPRSKKYWFNANGELKNTTGDLELESK